MPFVTVYDAKHSMVQCMCVRIPSIHNILYILHQGKATYSKCRPIVYLISPEASNLSLLFFKIPLISLRYAVFSDWSHPI